MFVFNEMSGDAPASGHDIVADYHAGEDTIEIGCFSNFTELQNALHADSDGNAVIAVDAGNSITLSGVSMAMVIAHQADFHLTGGVGI